MVTEIAYFHSCNLTVTLLRIITCTAISDIRVTETRFSMLLSGSGFTHDGVRLLLQIYTQDVHIGMLCNSSKNNGEVQETGTWHKARPISTPRDAQCTLPLNGRQNGLYGPSWNS
jgi:hypothetical protein